MPEWIFMLQKTKMVRFHQLICWLIPLTMWCFYLWVRKVQLQICNITYNFNIEILVTPKLKTAIYTNCKNYTHVGKIRHTYKTKGLKTSGVTVRRIWRVRRFFPYELWVFFLPYKWHSRQNRKRKLLQILVFENLYVCAAKLSTFIKEGGNLKVLCQSWNLLQISSGQRIPNLVASHLHQVGNFVHVTHLQKAFQDLWPSGKSVVRVEEGNECINNIIALRTGDLAVRIHWWTSTDFPSSDWTLMSQPSFARKRPIRSAATLGIVT